MYEMQNNIVKLQNHLSSFNPHLYCFLNFIKKIPPGSRNGHHIWNEHSVCCLCQERHFFVGTVLSTSSVFALQFYPHNDLLIMYCIVMINCLLVQILISGVES